MEQTVGYESIRHHQPVSRGRRILMMETELQGSSNAPGGLSSGPRRAECSADSRSTDVALDFGGRPTTVTPLTPHLVEASVRASRSALKPQALIAVPSQTFLRSKDRSPEAAQRYRLATLPLHPWSQRLELTVGSEVIQSSNWVHLVTKIPRSLAKSEIERMRTS